MKNIQLLTIESYLRTKKELIENANYTFDELNIDQPERIKVIIEEIIKEYFGEEQECEMQNFPRIRIWKKEGYIEVNATLQLDREVFLESLKGRYGQLIEEKRDAEIVNEIERVLSKEFIDSCRFSDGQTKRLYEIIKYTLTEEEQCDYLNNGKFISELSDEAIFPFEKKEDSLPIYCQNMQRVLFGVHRKIFANPNNCKKSLDITRFSFYNVKKIIDAVTKASMIEEKSVDYKEDSADYYKGYIEGVEDYILLDEILGISLTNIIYWKTKDIEKREIQDNIIEIVPHLARCHYASGRNAVAQVLLDYISATDYNEKIIREVGKVLKSEIRVWNEYYEELEAVVLCTLFSYLKDCSANDLIEVCKSIEDNNTWGEYIYLYEIAENIEEKEDKIRIPKGIMNKRTWYAYIHKKVFDAIWN